MYIAKNLMEDKSREKLISGSSSHHKN